MLPSKLRATIVIERLSWIERMLTGIRSLPLATLEEFTADARNPAAAESYLRRCLESLLDLGRHILAKGFGRAPAEYPLIGSELGQVGVLSPEEAVLLKQMAGYRNRMVHFYHEVTQEELYRICVEQLNDIERVVKAFKKWIRDHPESVDQVI